MPDDQTAGKVQHGPIRIGALFPADQQTAITIEPAVRAFDDPAPRPRAFPLGLALIASSANPRHHANLPDMVVHATTDIAPIQAQPRARCRRRLVDDDLRQRLFQQHAVVSMRAIDDQCQRQAVTISEQAALDAPFAVVGRVGADFFPRPMGLSSSCHRAPAHPNRSFRALRTPAVRHARSARRPPRRSTPETVDAPTNANTSRWHRAPHCIPVRSNSRIASIATRSGMRGRWQPSGCGFGGGINGAIRAHIASLKRQPSSCCELIASPSEQRIPFVGQARTQLFQPTGTDSKSPNFLCDARLT